MSILANNLPLSHQVNQVAEAAGYLWQKGWAERNGGNITVNVTEHITDEDKARPAIAGPFPIGFTLPNLKGCWFYCKGTQMRMRDLARHWPENLGQHILLEIFRIVGHSHELDRMSVEACLVVKALSDEIIVDCEVGREFGSGFYGFATIKALDDDYDVVMWEKHGVFAVDTDIMTAFDQIDVLNKSANIFMCACNMGFQPEGMSDAQMTEISTVFNLPK